MNIFLLLIIMLMNACNLFNTDNKEEPVEQKCEYHFQAKINGNDWQGTTCNAQFAIVEADSFLQVFSTRYDSLIYPYNDHINFTMNYRYDRSSYNILIQNESHSFLSGGFFTENDGDAVIARYKPISDELNLLEVNIDETGRGEKLINGKFSMKLLVDPDYDTEFNNQYRQQPDTVRITDGEFRVLLEEPRE